MKTRLIHEDMHGLYVKADGAIFRPHPNAFYAPLIEVLGGIALQTKYNAGEKVRVGSFADRQWQMIGDECWCKHGNCFESDNSEDLWEG